MKNLYMILLLIITNSNSYGQDLSLDSLRVRFGAVNDFIGNSNVTIAYKNGFGAMINKQGVQLTPYLYTQNFSFFDCDYYEKTNNYSKLSISPARIGKKIGLIDTNGIIRIPVIYDDLIPISATHLNCTPISYVDSLYFVKLNKKVGMIDLNGKIIIPIKYDGISKACNNLIRIYNTSNFSGIKDFKIYCGWANTKGKIFSEPKLTTIKCKYLELQLRAYKTTYGCENAKGHPCDPIPLECFQCQLECPTEKELLTMKKNNSTRKKEK